MIRSAFVALGLVLTAGSAWAQSGSDELTVTAVRPAQLREFVRQLAEPGKQEQMSTWDGKVCPGVVGVREGPAQALIDRVAARALSIGLEAGRPGCRANVLIIVTPDAARFTPSFVDQNKRFFSYHEDNGNSLGRGALQAFATNGRPVRWWHVSQTVTDRGQVLGQSEATNGFDTGISNAQIARVSNSGRLRQGTRQEFNRVIVIVDASAIAGKPFPAVADYVAMVSLAQIRADADRQGLETILNLFDTPAEGEAIPTGWTAWDEAYVKGLYEAPAFARSSKQQENAIVRSVEKQGEGAAQPGGEPQR
jgi:hypothetical protein